MTVFHFLCLPLSTPPPSKSRLFLPFLLLFPSHLPPTVSALHISLSLSISLSLPLLFRDGSLSLFLCVCVCECECECEREHLLRDDSLEQLSRALKKKNTVQGLTHTNTHAQTHRHTHK